MKVRIPKEREAEFLEWFEAQPKNEDGSVTIEHDGTQTVPIEVFGIAREEVENIPNVKIGARASQHMLDKLKDLKRAL